MLSLLSLSSLQGRIAAVLLSLIPLYYISYVHNSPTTNNNSTSVNSASHSFSISSNPFHRDLPRDEFVRLALNRQVNDPFNISAISNLCRSRPARSDIIIKCQPGNGGVGNIRSYMLHCTRFAMEVGASIILPNFQRRSKSDLFELFGQIADFEHFFDRQHFVDTLQQACPHITVHTVRNPGWTDGAAEIPHIDAAINESSIAQPSPWRVATDVWLAEQLKGKKTPVIITSGDPGRNRFVMDDGMDFYFHYGRILQFRPDARRLAMICVAEMSRRFKLHIDPDTNVYRKSYMGAHLRTSSDAVKAGWNPDFEQQTDWYINQTQTHGLRVIFAASGNDADLEKFAVKAKPLGIDVVNKFDLLEGNDLRELENMSWDQRGLIDFEILLRGEQYGGYARSSFSHNMAFRRHFMSGMRERGESPFEIDPLNHFRDEWSVVYGRFDAGWEAEAVRTMWP